MDSRFQRCCVWVLLFGTISSCIATSIIPSSEATGSNPQVIVVQKNSPLLLNCSDPTLSWINNSEVKFTWFKDGEVVTPDSRRVSVNQNGSLYFQSIKRKKRKGLDDEGLYECQKTFTVGTVIVRRVKVQIARISRTFTKDPQDQITVRGGVARFECQVEATPPQVKYIWNKDGQQLSSNNRYTELPMGVLQIQNVQDSDKGAYSCSALNTFADAEGALPSSVLRHSKEGTLTVLAPSSGSQTRPPWVVTVSTMVNTTVGGSAILECLADGIPNPQISWQKIIVTGDQTKEVPVEEGFRVRRMGPGNLRFTKVTESDQGMYKCVALTSSGQRNSTETTILNIHYPPTLVTRPKSGDYPVVLRTRLDCEAQGNPTPTYTWYHNGKKVKEDPGHILFKENNKQLVLDTSISDSGFYQCIAENPYGSETATARIQITLGKYAPLPPNPVKATPVSTTAINVTWDVPCCHVFVYTVHYKWVSPDTKEENLKQLVIQKDNHCLVQQLLPFTTYHFFIRAYNRNGSSEESEIVTATTLQSVPLVAPRIRTSSLSVGTITVDWSPLLAREKRGVITQYKIYFQKMDGGQEQTNVIHNDTTTYTIHGLLPDQVYRVRVLAGTDMGYPVLNDNNWPWVSQRTLSKDSPCTVTPAPLLEVTPLNNSAVKVTWEVSNTSSEVTGFKLYINRKIGPVYSRYIQLGSDSNSTIVSGLETRIYYEAVLEALGENETVSGKACRLFQALSPQRSPEPPPPMDIKVFARTPHSLSLNWSIPHWGEGITYYTVCYHVKDDDRKIMYERSDSQNHTLQDLTPYTTYTVSVRSHSTLTTGPFGTPQDITTLEDVPSPPEGVTLYPLSEGEVKLMWKPPTQRNGIIIFYIIQYHPELEDPEPLWTSMHSNGTLTQAVVRDLTSTVYYFKLRACTNAGKGPPSDVVKVVLNPCIRPCDGGNSSPPISSFSEGSDSFLRDQRLGIVIGCAIGLTSIIVCILVIVLRQRHYANLYRHSTRMVANPELGYRYQHQGYQTPETRRLMLVDRQGKDCYVPGTFMACNGKLLTLAATDRQTDRVPTEAEQEPGENACLLWHQQGLNHAHSDGNQSLSNDSGASLSCDIRGVSPESSSERNMDSTWGSTRGNNLLSKASGGGGGGETDRPPQIRRTSPEMNRAGSIYNDTAMSHSDQLLKKMLEATSAELKSKEKLDTDLHDALATESQSLDMSHQVNTASQSASPESLSKQEDLNFTQQLATECDRANQKHVSPDSLSRSADFVSRSDEHSDIC